MFSLQSFGVLSVYPCSQLCCLQLQLQCVQVTVCRRSKVEIHIIDCGFPIKAHQRRTIWRFQFIYNLNLSRCALGVCKFHNFVDKDLYLLFGLRTSLSDVYIPVFPLCIQVLQFWIPELVIQQQFYSVFKIYYLISLQCVL